MIKTAKYLENIKLTHIIDVSQLLIFFLQQTVYVVSWLHQVPPSPLLTPQRVLLKTRMLIVSNVEGSSKPDSPDTVHSLCLEVAQHLKWF